MTFVYTEQHIADSAGGPWCAYYFGASVAMLGEWADPFNVLEYPIETEPGAFTKWHRENTWFWFDTTGLSGGIPGGDPFAGLLPNPQPPPPPKWKDCLSALRENPSETYSAALLRATNSWGTLETAGAANGVDPAILASIGLYESNFQPNAMQKGGQGVGAFQIDLGQHPNVTVAQAQNLGWAANYAAGLIMNSFNLYSNRGYPTPLAMAGAIRNYNGGGGIPTSTLLNTGWIPYLDLGTKNNKYVTSVLNILLNCF
jgi:hypothetical protein